MAGASAGRSLDLHLHPLVVLNVSDHWTRHRVQGNMGRICGAMLGAIEGRRLDIHATFELLVDCPNSDEMHMDDELFQIRLSQFAEVFPNCDFVGWYSTGKEPNKQDICMLRRLEQLNENPYLLLLDTEASVADEQQGNKLSAVRLYERKLQMVAGTTCSDFQVVDYTIDMGEAERISVAHVARNATLASSKEPQSDYVAHLSSINSAVGMLSSRVSFLKEYLQEVKGGRIPKSHAILRELFSVCCSVRATQTAALQKEFYDEYNDTLLTVFLSTVTKSASQLNEFLDKFVALHEGKLQARYGHGLSVIREPRNTLL